MPRVAGIGRRRRLHRVIGSGLKVRQPTNPRTDFVFAGTPVAPEICPRANCGQQVRISVRRDEPAIWHCFAGHSGVIAEIPVGPRPTMTPPPKGICFRCRVNRVSGPRNGRGGASAMFCDDCVVEGRRHFGEPIDPKEADA